MRVPFSVDDSQPVVVLVVCWIDCGWRARRVRHEAGEGLCRGCTGEVGGVHVTVKIDMKSCRCQNSCVLRAAMVQNRFM
jgi:hypothetical protein